MYTPEPKKKKKKPKPIWLDLQVYEGKIGDAWVWAKWWEAWNRHLYKGL